MSYLQNERMHDSHKWHPRHGTYNALLCKECGLTCTRAPGGDGWAPGDWRYYDHRGNDGPLFTCPSRRPTLE